MKNLEKLQSMEMKKLVLLMSIPAITGMLVQGLYNVVDSIFIAQISQEALTALSIAFPIQMIIISTFVGIGIGVNAYMSTKLGEGNKNVAFKTAENGLLLGIILWAIIALSSLFLPEVFVRLFTKDELVLKYAISYLKIVMLLSFGSIIAELCMNVQRATGDSISSMKIQLLGAITNVVLDPILIFGLLFIPKLNIEGAAIATVIGQIASMFYGLYIVSKSENGITLSIRNLVFDKDIINGILKVGIPTILMTGLSSVMVAGINLILTTISSTSIAVYGAYFKVQQFVMMPVFGIGQGIMPIIGFNYGSKNIDRVKKAIKYGMIGSLFILSLGLILFEFFPLVLLKLFNSNSEMIELGVTCFRICGFSIIFTCISIPLTTTFQAIHKPQYSLLISLTRQIVLLLPLAFILSKTLGIIGVWWAFGITELLVVILSMMMYKREKTLVISKA